jgi:RHS repeat-associated protein
MYAYDPANRLSTVTQTLAGAPGGQVVWRYAYDIQGNLTSVTDPNGNVTNYLYDDFTRTLSQTSPVSGVTVYTYDAAGNALTTTDANGATTARTYDPLNRVLSSVSTRGSTETVSYTYDDGTAGNFGIGRVSTLGDPTGTTVYRYERRGLLRSEVKTIAGSAYTTAFTYDANGNRSTLTYSNGVAAQYTHDFADRPYSLTNGTTTVVSSATYLPFGPLATLAFGNGTTRTMSYDARYRPLENKLIGPGGTIADYTYAEDNNGNITQIHDSISASYNRDFGYDDLNRLTTANSGTTLWGGGSYTYDAMGNMLSSSLGTWKTTSSSLVGTTPKLGSVVENGAARGVTYDAAGNEIAVGSSAFTYSPRNTLASADTSSYAYDGRGLRTIATFSFFSLTATPDTVVGGNGATGVVALNTPAAADTTISLSSSNSGAATVPPSVMIPTGQLSASFGITTSPVSASITTTLSATFNQYTTAVPFTIAPPDLASLTIAPMSTTSGSTATGTVALTGPPATDVVILLSSNNAAASVPASVTLPSGSISASFSITTTVGTNATIVITATLNGTSRQASLTLSNPELTSLSISPTSVVNGGTATATMTLNSPAGSNFVVTITQSGSGALPPGGYSVTVPPGATTATFSLITALQSFTASTVTFTVTRNFVSRQATLTVNPPWLASFAVSPQVLIGGDAPSTGTATLNGVGSNGPGGYMVTFMSSNTSLIATPQPLYLTGRTSGQTTILTNPVLSSTPVVVTATDSTGVNLSQTMTLQPLPVTISSLTLGATSIIGSNSVTGTITLTASAPAPGVDVDLQSSNLALVDPGTYVHVATGATTASFAFKTAIPIANTNVTISAVHGATTRSVALTVQKPTAANYVASLSLSSPYYSPAGNPISGTVSLNASATARTTVTLSSSNTAVATVPASVTISKGSQTQTFTITTSAGLASPADVTITASAGGTIAPVTITVYPLNSIFMTGVGLGTPTVQAGGGYYQIGTVCLSANVPAGGLTLSFTGSRSNVVDIYGYNSNGQQTVGSAYIPPGYACAWIFAHTYQFTGINRRTTISSTVNGITRSAALQITAQPQALLGRPDPIRCAAIALSPCLSALPQLAIDSNRPLRPEPQMSGDSSGYYLYNPEMRLLAETEVSTTAAKSLAYSYFWFADMPVAAVEVATNTTRWYATDQLGTPYVMTDAAGTPVWRAEYAPYGSVFSMRTGASLHQPLRFPGQVAQDGTETYYNVFRHYRSSWGRYTQADPLGLQPGANMFEYTRDNPIRYVDLFGLWETGGYPGPKDATVVCEGGEMIPWIGANFFPTRKERECLKDCAELHENSHMNDIVRVKHDICRGEPHYVRVNPSSKQERDDSEVKAYNVEYNCLKNNYRRQQHCCETEIKQRMGNIEELAGC